MSRPLTLRNDPLRLVPGAGAGLFFGLSAQSQKAFRDLLVSVLGLYPHTFARVRRMTLAEGEIDKSRFYSRISSAPAKIFAGNSTPSAFAARMSITSSKRVGFSTGKALSGVPVAARTNCRAARRKPSLMSGP